jgi:hypothetical protein
MVEMLDLAHPDRLHRAFTALLGELAGRWPGQDIDYVKDEAEHGEYGDALENLIAIGLRNGRGFKLSQVRQIERLAAAMEMVDSPFLAQLKAAIHDKDKIVRQEHR